MDNTKPFAIPKQSVWEAYKRVKANQGSAGVDGQSIEDFERDLTNNLYKLWNRMASGSYFPPPVKAVEIPKGDGGTRLLGVPTVSDRIAQMVVVQYLEPEVEKLFHPDSYGYRPGRSAHDALETARKRCLHYRFCIDLDIRGFFDGLDHKLLMHAVRKHTECRWVLLYIERWLKVPVALRDGSLVERTQGTPQGGVCSPLLANIFLHHAFDQWMTTRFPALAFERYADDIVVHCRTEKEALYVRDKIAERLGRCKLTLHPEKTKLVYCKDDKRTEPHESYSFDFLGYRFRPRSARARAGNMYVKFSPAISPKAQNRIATKIRRLRIHLWVSTSLESIARELNPLIRGWLEYYGKYNRSELRPTLQRIDDYLIRWAQGKYRRLQGHRLRAVRWLGQVRQRQSRLFAHWEAGMAWV